MTDEEENPISTGLVALVAVAVVVGLLAGIAVLLGTRMIGISGETDLSGEDPEGAASMYLPDPVPTTGDPGPAITLLPTETATATPTATPTATATRSRRPKDDAASLNLTASPLQAAPGEEIMLSGTYTNGEGSVLDIFQKVGNGEWREFTIDVYVSGGIFQTYVQTWQTGEVRWKVVDSLSKRESEPVTVRIG